jgi:hypothetical protein
MNLQRLLRLLAFVTPVACTAATPDPRTRAAEPARNFYDCPDPKVALGARAKFDEAKRTLDACDELCRKTSNGGYRVAKAVELLHAAARDGDREAQALWGKTAFESAFLDSGDDNLPEAPIVESLAYLRLAARRGSPLAREFLPAVVELRLSGVGSLEGEPQAPLASIPREWLARAVDDADRALRCYPDQITRRWVLGKLVREAAVADVYNDAIQPGTQWFMQALMQVGLPGPGLQLSQFGRQRLVQY